METFKSAAAFSFCNINRWKKDLRVWLVLLFTLFIIIEYLTYCSKKSPTSKVVG